MCFQKFFPPILHIFWNLPSYLDNLCKLPTCACRNAPQFADFLKSATGQLPMFPTCVCRNSPPQFADFLKSATGQLPRLPSWNLPMDSYVSYLHVLAEIPASLQIFWNLPLDRYLCVSAEIPLICRFFWNLPLDSYLSYLICAYRNLPLPVCQIFWKLPLASYLSYLHVLAEIAPQFADFLKSATGQLPKFTYMHFTEIPPPVCRFSEICHWTVT